MATAPTIIGSPGFVTGNGTTGSIVWPSFPANSSVYVFIVESNNWTITPSGTPATWQNAFVSGQGQSLGTTGANGYTRWYWFTVNAAGQYAGTTTTFTLGGTARFVLGYVATTAYTPAGRYTFGSTDNVTSYNIGNNASPSPYSNNLPLIVTMSAPVATGAGVTFTIPADQTSLGQTTTAVGGVDNVGMAFSTMQTSPAVGTLTGPASAVTLSTASHTGQFLIFIPPSDEIVPARSFISDDVNPGIDPTATLYTPVTQTGTANVTISPTTEVTGAIVPIALRAATAPTFGTSPSLTWTLPAGAVQNDLLIGFYGGKNFNTTVTSGTIATDYTLQASGTNGTTAAGNGTGSMYAAAYTRVHDGTEANPTGTLSATPNVAATAMIALRATTPAGALWTVQGTFASTAASAGTTYSVTGADTLPYKAGDWVVAQYVHNDDSSSNSAFTVSVPGCVVGEVTQRLTGTLTSALGGDMRMYVVTAPIESGIATGAPTISATVGTGDADGSSTILLARAPGDAANLSISPTSASAALATKPATATQTAVTFVAPNTPPAATATATKTATATNVTVSPTPLSEGFVSSSRATTGVTVSPAPNANPAGIIKDISGVSKTFGTIVGRLGLGVTEHIGVGTQTAVSPTPTATAGAASKPATALSTLVDDTTAATAGALLKSAGATGVTVSRTVAATGTANKTSAATNVTVSPTVTSVAQGTVKPATATNTSVVTTQTATPGAVTRPLNGASSVALTTTAAGVVNDSGLASVTTTPTVAAAGVVTDATTANNVTVSPTPAATSTKSITATATNVTVSPTTNAVPQPIVDTTSAITVTVAPTTSAAGLSDKTTSTSLTVSPTPASSGFVTQFGTTNTVTVSPTPAATAAGTTKPGTVAQTISPSTTSAGRVTDLGTATSSTSPTPTAAGTSTKTSSAVAVTVTPTVVAAGVVNDEGTGSTTVTPAVSAAAGAVLKTSAATATTTTPTTDADGVSDKDQTANNVQTAPTVSAAGFVTDTGTVVVAVTRTVAATGLRTVNGNSALTSVATLTADPGLHPFFRSGNENNSGTSAGTVATVTIPADVQDGDMALVYLSKGNQTPYDTTPTGYTLLGTQNAGTEHQTSVWYKVLTTSDASTVAQASWSTSSLWSMGVVVYGSVDSIIDGWSAMSGGPGTALTWDFTPSTHPETTAVLISGTRRVNTGGPYTHAFSEV